RYASGVRSARGAARSSRATVLGGLTASRLDRGGGLCAGSRRADDRLARRAHSGSAVARARSPHPASGLDLGMQAVQFTGPVTFHGEGPFWDAAAQRLLVVDLLAGEVLDLADPATPVRHRIGSVAAAIRARRGGG